jgi:hypothetical protein
MIPLGFIPDASENPTVPGGVERGIDALAQQKRVSDACGIVVFPYDVARSVAPSSKRKRRARKVDRGVRPFVEQVSLTLCRTSTSTNVRVRTDDCTRWVHDAGRAADCGRGWIENCYDAFLGHYKAVLSVSSAKKSTGRVGAGRS